MGEIDYQNFDLQFEPAGEKKYKAQVISSPAGEAEVDFAPPFSPEEQKKFLAIFAGQVRNASRWEQGKEFGRRLFEAVFQGNVLGCFRSSLDSAKQRGVGLRLRLRLKNVPELAALPWEYLYNAAVDRFPAISTWTPIVRYLELPETIPSLKINPPLNVLVMISSPLDHPQLDVEQEWANFKKAFHKLSRKRLVQLDRLDEATLPALQKILHEREYHIFHFIGHGDFNEKTGEGALIFTNEDGRGCSESGQKLGTILGDRTSLRLAVLNACLAAKTSRWDPFAGCAQRLVQQSLPAVIAMQFQVGDAGAITFADTFYDFLTAGYPVDGALAEARKAIFSRDRDGDWAAPVLYMRSPDGRLFDFKKENTAAAIDEQKHERALQRIESGISKSPSPFQSLSKPVRVLTAGTLLLLVLASLIWFWPRQQSVPALPVIPLQKHLLVLPLTNVGHDSTNQAFCDGLMETLTSRVTQLEQYAQRTLWVVPATEVREKMITSAEAARRKFGVNMVVSGSVQRDQEKVLLTVNLVDAATLRQIDAFVMSERNTEMAGLQDKIVLKLAKILQVDLQSHAQKAITAGGTAVPGANAFYLQGRGYLLQYRNQAKNLETALALFQRALEHDSLYALAFAGLGETFWKKYALTSEAQWIEPAERNCRRALELDVLVAPAYVTLARIYNGTGQYEQALQETQRALELDSTNADARRLQALAYENLGRLKEAETTYKQAIALKPDYWDGYNNLGVFYVLHGRNEEAVTQFQQVVALTPDNVVGYNNLGAIYSYLERYDESRAMFERSLVVEPSDEAYNNLATLDFMEAKYAESAQRYAQALQLDSTDYQVWGNLASAYYWMPGAEPEAQRYYRRAVNMAEEKKRVNPRDAVVMADLAEYGARLGQRDRAREHIVLALAHGKDNVNIMATAALVYEALGERALALQWTKKALANGYALATIEHEPGFRDLRRDPGFQKLVRQQH
ncbi:MAG: tetratricopeptide repeat protein [bacterium]